MIQADLTHEVVVNSALAAARGADCPMTAMRVGRDVLSRAYHERRISIVHYANALHDLRKAVDEEHRIAAAAPQ